MTLIIFLLFVMGAAAIRVFVHQVEYALIQNKKIQHLLKRGFRMDDYAILPTMTDSEKFEEEAMLSYENQIHAEEKIFHLYLSFCVFYACASALSIVSALYFMGMN